jgi:hypothetical protein
VRRDGIAWSKVGAPLVEIHCSRLEGIGDGFGQC